MSNTPPTPSSGASEAMIEHCRRGSELSLHTFNADRTSIITKRIFLFMRDTSDNQSKAASLYGRAGSLYWTFCTNHPNGSQSRQEIDSQRLQLHTLTDLRSGKQTELFKSSSLSRLPDNTCFSLTSNTGIEMNLTAVSAEDKDKWWKTILFKLQSGKKQLLITNSNSANQSTPSNSNNQPTNQSTPSSSAPNQSSMANSMSSGALMIQPPTPSSHSVASPNSANGASPTQPLSPGSLKKMMHTGSFLKKFDIDLQTQKVTSTSIFLWTEGTDKAHAALYWLEASEQPHFTAPPSSTIPASHTLQLSKITDFMLKKKSLPLKSSTAPESCCFALVASDKSILNLECATREMAKNWREGLISLLLTAGKQVVRADSVTDPKAVSPYMPTSLKRSPSEEKDLFVLTTGAVFTLYYVTNNTPVVAKVTLFFVELLAPSDPGALCWCNVGSKRMIEGQRLMLNTMKQMVSGCDHSAFRAALTGPNGASANPDACFTIVGKNLVLNLEAGSHAMRELWMKGLHSIMLKFQDLVAEKKRIAQEMAAKAAHEILSSSGETMSSTPRHARTPSPSSLNRPPSPVSGNSSSLNSQIASLALDDQIPGIKQGNTFTLYKLGPNNEITSHSVFLFYVDIADSTPGYLYYCSPPPAQRAMIETQKFALSTVNRMIAGKETPVFTHDRLRNVMIERCLSIIGKQSTLNLEAVNTDVRDFWIKTLHSIMSRFRPAKTITSSQTRLDINSPTPNSVIQPSSVTPSPLSAPVGSPPSPQVLAAIPANSPPSLAKEPEALWLAQPHPFKHYASSQQGFPIIHDIVVFFVPLSGAEHPGALFWCAPNKLETKESQKLLLSRITQLAGGKETQIFKHAMCANVPKERCLFLTSSSVSLSLEAPNIELKSLWMQQLHSLMVKVGRVTVDQKVIQRAKSDSGASPSPQVHTPSHGSLPTPMGHAPSPVAVPQSAPPQLSVASPSVISPSPSPTSAAKSTVDIKQALATVQTGQLFTMYYNNNGIDVAEPWFFFFVPSSGPDQPGSLYWNPTASVAGELNSNRRFVLNTIKQMRAGKDTPILRGPLAARARYSHCLSLSSSSITLNLEAPNSEIAELWRKSLHTVLVRHGMKAVEDTQAAQPNGASAEHNSSNESSPSNALTPGSSRPLGSHSVAQHINRTINFMDPTEFFVLKAKIGEGSYGAVFKAIDIRDQSTVAIKIIPFSGKDSLKLRKEIRTLRQCNSPFVVGYKGAFHKDSNVWIVMEYCAAGSLSDIMQICERTLSEVQISNVMKQCLAGLSYLHSQGKIHRDIKGGNILADARGFCKLADFGVSGNLDKTLGKHRTVIGTPHWMAPEVLMSDDYNEVADVWSLGITAYELACGEPPHAKLHSMRAALKIPMSPAPTLPDPKHWSPLFHSFIAACLVKDFHHRPSAADLLNHPFIVNAAPNSVLMEMVSTSTRVIEQRANELARQQQLGGKDGSKPGSGTQVMPMPVAGEVKDDLDDADDIDSEDDMPRIRPNPARGNAVH